MPGDAHRRLRALVRVFFCLTPDSVRGFAHQEHQGGTIIGTTNRGNPLTVTVTVPGKDRGCGEVDRTDELVRLGRMHDLDALNRPYAAEKGVRVIAVPKTKRPSATTIGAAEKGCAGHCRAQDQKTIGNDHRQRPSATTIGNDHRQRPSATTSMAPLFPLASIPRSPWPPNASIGYTSRWPAAAASSWSRSWVALWAGLRCAPTKRCDQKETGPTWSALFPAWLCWLCWLCWALHVRSGQQPLAQGSLRARSGLAQGSLRARSGLAQGSLRARCPRSRWSSSRRP